MLGQHAGCSTTSNNSCPSSTPSCRLGLELYHNHFQVQDLLWIPRHITAQRTLIPTYTYINNNTYTYVNIHLYQHTLISTITLTPQPLTTTIYHFTFYILPLACQHKKHKQCKQTHQRYCSKTVITFLIIHYQVLRHQECAHSLGCSQY